MNLHSQDAVPKDIKVSEGGARVSGRPTAPSYDSSEQSPAEARRQSGVFSAAQGPGLGQSWQQRFARLATAADEFLAAVHSSNGDTRRICAMSSKLSHACEPALRAVRTYAWQEGREGLEMVANLVLEVLPKWIQNDNSRGTAKVLSTLVVMLQQYEPQLAVEVARSVAREGGTLSAPTVLCTIMDGILTAESPRDIAGIFGLAEEALTRGLVPVSSSKTVKFYNVLLAACGEPSPTASRVGPRYRDIDTLDVAERLLNAAPVACAAINANLPFEGKESEGRINLFVRALCSASLILDVEQVRIWEQLSPQEVTRLRREFGADTKLWSHISRERKGENLRAPAYDLVSRAIELTEAAMKSRGRGGPDRAPMYEIRGSTVNVLFNAAFFSMALSVDQAQSLLSILSTALDLASVRRKLHSASIEKAVLAALSAAYEAEEPGELLSRACAAFTLARRKGFACSDSLMGRILDSYDKLPPAILEEKSVRDDIAYLKSRRARPSREARVRPRKIAVHSQPLKGGLAAPKSSFLTSFAELHESMRVKDGA